MKLALCGSESEAWYNVEIQKFDQIVVCNSAMIVLDYVVLFYKMPCENVYSNAGMYPKSGTVEW